VNDLWSGEPEDEEPALPVPGMGYRKVYVRIDGVSIRLYDHPPCVDYDESDCSQCDFFTPQTCRLRRDPTLVQDIRALFRLHRQRLAVYSKLRQKLIRAMHFELRQHGRALHYTVVARMVKDRYPEFQVTAKRILLIMAAHPKEFEKVRQGVYRSRVSPRS